MGKLRIMLVHKRLFAFTGMSLVIASTILGPMQLDMMSGSPRAVISVAKADEASCTQEGGTWYVTLGGASTGKCVLTSIKDANTCRSKGQNYVWEVTPNTTGGVTQQCDDNGASATNGQAQDSNAGKSNSCNSFATCVSDLVYLVTVGPTSIFAYIGSLVMSIGVKLSLTSTAYALQFLTDGWSIARDVANMAFLFILIFLAFSIILKADSSGTTQTLALIIVMALLVNFSFFLTRVVVDAGNIAAVEVYNVIPNSGQAGATYGCTQNSDGTSSGVPFICSSGMKDLTASIMSALNMQNLYSTPSFQKWASGTGSLTQLLTLCALYISTAILLAILGFVFLSVGAKFLVRIVALWLLIIASPLAFAAYSLPQTKHFFKQWWTHLWHNTFYPVIFLFLFLFVILFMNGLSAGTQGLGIVGNIFNTQSFANNVNPLNTAGWVQWFVQVIGVVSITMGLVVILIYMAMKVSDKVSVSGANIVTKFPGWVAGRYAGAIGFAGRRTLGYAGAMAARSDTLRDSGLIGNTLWRLGGRASRASFDFRAAPGASVLGGVRGLGKAGGQGGADASIRRRSERLYKRGEAVLDTDEQKEKRLRSFNERFFNDRGIGFDEAIAREKGKENQANKQLEEMRDRISKLQVKRNVEGGKFKDDADAEELVRLEEQRAQLAATARAAQKQASDWTKARTLEVEDPEGNRKRLEEFMKSGPLLSTNMPGTSEAIGRLRKLLPEMAPIAPGETVTTARIAPGQMQATNAAIPTRPPINSENVSAPPKNPATSAETSSGSEAGADAQADAARESQIASRLREIIDNERNYSSTPVLRTELRKLIDELKQINANHAILREAENKYRNFHQYDSAARAAQAEAVSAKATQAINDATQAAAKTAQEAARRPPMIGEHPLLRTDAPAPGSPEPRLAIPGPGAPQHIERLPGPPALAEHEAERQSGAPAPGAITAAQDAQAGSAIRKFLGARRSNTRGMNPPKTPPPAANSNEPPLPDAAD